MRFLAVLAASFSAIGTAAAHASTFAVDDPGIGATLYRIDAPHATETAVATVHSNQSALPLTDIALDSHGRLYGSTFASLYRVNAVTGLATKLANFPESSVNGLAFDSHNRLYASTLSGTVVRVNSHGRFRLVARTPGVSSGDIVFISPNVLVESVVGADGDILYRIDVRSHRVRPIGATHVPTIYGLFVNGPSVYGVTSRDVRCTRGSLLRVNVRNGATSPPACLPANFGGAAAPYHRVHLGAGAARNSADFFSPTGNLKCEMLTSQVRCIAEHRFARADLNRRGKVTTCRNELRCDGDLGERAFELRYGRSVRVGPFRCTSRTTGITCKVVRTGKGFLINRRGVKRVG